MAEDWTAPNSALRQAIHGSEAKYGLGHAEQKLVRGTEVRNVFDEHAGIDSTEPMMRPRLCLEHGNKGSRGFAPWQKRGAPSTSIGFRRGSAWL